MTEFFDYNQRNGLVDCSRPELTTNSSELLYIHEASKMGVNAVLFRRVFRQGEQVPFRSEPAVCIFSKEDTFFDSDEHIRLHAKLWSAGNNEIYIIKGQTRIHVVNARKPAEPISDAKRLSIKGICLASQGIKEYDEDGYKRFSAVLFNTGSFWEQDQFKDQLDSNKSPYILLLRYLLSTRSMLQNEATLQIHPEVIDKLLVTSILIKFLEERDDDDGKHTLKEIYDRYHVADFSEVLSSGITLNVLKDLASAFSGKIFDRFSETEKGVIQVTNLSVLADFLTGKINLEKRQYSLWEQYNFKYLPAEVISAIYENFIQADAIRQSGNTEKGIVYTPIHLVNFLIDDVMPLDKAHQLFSNQSFRVLDPACGSGVFLVAAYRRLLQWWTINNSHDGNIRYPGSKVALQILNENIYGVDLKETATFISIFGLTTALIDALTPKELWNNLELIDLSNTNIQFKSFFDWLEDTGQQGALFDLVIGNPPFNPITGDKNPGQYSGGSNVLLTALNQVPRNNLALKFFEASLFLGKKVCMILPSQVVLYDPKSGIYRRRLFTDFTVKKIYDFTHLRRGLFHKSADTPIIAIAVENIESKQESIEHIVVKRMLLSEKRLRFEIDYYDKHFVKWERAVNPQMSYLWKVNLLGGGRLFHIIYRLTLLPTFKNFIESLKLNNSEWVYNTGYKVGGNTKKKQADFINKGLKIDHIDEEGGFKISETGEKTDMLEYTPDEKLYTPPMIVIDQRLGRTRIPSAFIPEFTKRPYLYFNRDFVGIHAPLSDVDTLGFLYEMLHDTYRELYLSYVTVMSGSCLVSTETEINKRDIDALPFPSDRSYLTLSENERLIIGDLLNYHIHLGKSTQKDAAGYFFEELVSKEQLNMFGTIFCSILNETYQDNDRSWQCGSVLRSSAFIIYQFGFGNKGAIKDAALEEDETGDVYFLMKDYTTNAGAIYSRIIKFYEHRDGFDCVLLIKPPKFKYWMNSIAIRDADDTYLELKQEGF